MLGFRGVESELKKGSIVVENSKKNFKDGYIMVTLGDVLKVYDTPALDVTKSSPSKEIHMSENGYVLKPNELYLGRTNEWTETYGFVPLLSENDNLAALGMEIHVTAGFGDNGFEGTWTLEIVCANPTRVYPNMPIGRLQYLPLIGDPEMQYRGKYYKQMAATESKLSAEYSEPIEKNTESIEGPVLKHVNK